MGKVTPNVGKTEVIARDELHLVGVWRGVPVVMFEGYRNGVFALGLIIGVGMATASILWVFGLNYCPNQPCRYIGAADDPSGNHGRVWQFPSAMRGTFSFPLEPDLAEGSPKRYEYYDLRAQERMAHATDWIAWLTLVSSVISAFGLVALLYSLAQTKRAISDTREIGEAQVRAYMSITAVKAEASISDDEVVLSFDVSIENSGQSPARGVELIVDEHRNTDWPHTARVVFGDIPAGLTVERRAKERFALKDLRLPKNDESLVSVRFTARGRDVFDGRVVADEWFQAKTTIADGRSFDLKRPNVTVIGITNGTGA